MLIDILREDEQGNVSRGRRKRRQQMVRQVSGVKWINNIRIRKWKENKSKAEDSQ